MRSTEKRAGRGAPGDGSLSFSFACAPASGAPRHPSFFGTRHRSPQLRGRTLAETKEHGHCRHRVLIAAAK